MANGQDQSSGAKPSDPFTAYWADMMSKMGMGMGMAAPSTSASAGVEPEYVKQMRQAFFQSMARYAEEFMRSEQFLTAMKQGMDNALAFRQQLDRFLTNTVHGAQQPAREDTDHILLVIRSMEERVLRKLEELSERVSTLEDSSGGGEGDESEERASRSTRRGGAGKGRKSGG